MAPACERSFVPSMLFQHPVLVMLAAGTTAAAPSGVAVALPFRWLDRRMTKKSTHTSAAPPLGFPRMLRRLSNINKASSVPVVSGSGGNGDGIGIGISGSGSGQLISARKLNVPAITAGKSEKRK
jgi:hypothetical protein